MKTLLPIAICLALFGLYLQSRMDACQAQPPQAATCAPPAPADACENGSPDGEPAAKPKPT